MILLLDSSTGNCQLTIIDQSGERFDYNWQADRSLARELLRYLQDRLAEHQKNFHDISGLAVMQGPGSFTGLRIGITVMNTLADSLKVPIVGEVGSAWQQNAIARLGSGGNDQIVLPEYGAEANITKPKK